MEVRIQKWGNSSGIRIPSSMLKNLVTVQIEHDKN